MSLDPSPLSVARRHVKLEALEQAAERSPAGVDTARVRDLADDRLLDFVQ
jgi:hypothetical protein